MNQDLRASQTLPPVALMFTCKKMHGEVLPLYFRTIHLRPKFRRERRPPAIGEILHGRHPALKPLKYYAKLDPSIADYLYSLRLESTIIYCNIKVTDSRFVHVVLTGYGDWISSKALTFMSVVIRNKILDSLVDSPTGLLGVRHLLTAHREIHQLWEWRKWKQEEEGRIRQKLGEATRYTGESCPCTECESYIDFLIEQAEEEGMYQNA